jgi:hypothetical protein
MKYSMEMNLMSPWQMDSHQWILGNRELLLDFGNKLDREGNHDGFKGWERRAKLIGIINGDEVVVILKQFMET